MSETLKKIRRFYAQVDKKSLTLAQAHAERLNCRRGCASCCVDKITVWNIEAENIRQTQAKFLSTAIPNTAGGCAFLDDAGACRIYESRPYVCRTQGLPLRWFDEIETELYEFRDICPLNENDQPIEEISENDCWTIGEAEEALAKLENQFDNGEMQRIALRDLFTDNG